jgi:osmotically-inducible protein OsmY
VVYLTGFVESAADKRAIDRVVRRVASVQGLRDYLHVRPP